MKKLGTMLVALAACAALTMSLTGSASGRVVASSHVTIKTFLPLYHGKVKSDYPQCAHNRKVKLFRKQSGPDDKIGKDKTNSHGRWHVAFPGDPNNGDKFYAKVGVKNVSSVGTGLSCAGDKSPTVTFVGG
jgi:hypothetical protein